MSLSFDDVRNLPLPDLSLSLLRSLGTEPNFNNLIQGFKQRNYDQPKPPDLEAMLDRLSDAWAWLESYALVGPSSRNPQGSTWSRVTSRGKALLEDPNALSKVWADNRLTGGLHPALSSSRSNFALGDYETAATWRPTLSGRSIRRGIRLLTVSITSLEPPCRSLRAPTIHAYLGCRSQ